MSENIIGLIAQILSKKGVLTAHNRGAHEFNTLDQVRSDSTENKLNPIQFLIYYNVQFA